jgi:signal transduction histidine kinase
LPIFYRGATAARDKGHVAAHRLAMVSNALAAGRPASDDEQDAFGLARSVELLAGLGGRAGVVVGALLFVLTALDGGLKPASWLVLGIGVVAVSFGTVLIRTPRALPVVVMDVVAVAADGALVLLAHLNSYVVAAMPGIYLVMGTIIIAVRRWQVAVTHALLLGASYVGVLVVSQSDRFAPAKWLIMMSCIIGAGLFVRWLVASVSALARAERSARDRAERAGADLERVGAAKTAFLAHMSHELRTPLNVALGYADLLAEHGSGPLNAQQEGYLDDIRTSARHLVELVDEVFDLARADTGGVHLMPGPVDVRSVLDDALSLVRGQLAERRVTAALAVPHGLPAVEADRLKVRQVVVNLVVNAAKFTPPGGSIVLSAHRIEDGVRVRVTDTGVGISPQDQERIFEEYAQSGSPAEGTGLGLPLARRLIEMHGGTLELAETSAAGSTFTFTLPHRQAGPATQPVSGVDAEHESDLFAAFGRPGSPANRRLLGQIGCVFAISGSVITTLVALIGPPSRSDGVIGICAAVVTAALAVFAYRRVSRKPIRHVEPYLWGVTAMTTAITYYGGPYAPLLPLTYGFVTIIGFTFLPRSRAFGHLLGIAACYGAILLVRTPTNGVESWLSLLALLAFDGGIVSWMNQQLRALAVAEHAARSGAELVCAELAEASRHKSAFVANMSHELRTPLNAVIGFADLLEAEVAGPLAARQRDYVLEVRSAARHLLAIINDVLDMAKLDAGQLRISPELTAVRPLIDSAIARATAGPARQLQIEAHIDDDVEYLVADPVRMEEVVKHLVSNAVRFTPDGGRVSIAVRRAPHDEVHIAVTDTGVGIAPDQCEHVFDAFSPGPAVGGEVRVGTGTGLALARGLVEVHGGRLWLTSRAGRGSTFTIALLNQSAAAKPLAGSAS